MDNNLLSSGQLFLECNGDDVKSTLIKFSNKAITLRPPQVIESMKYQTNKTG
mgnify:FL=1|jgi:hypothetical protein